VADSLAHKYQSTIALPPAYGDKNIKPERPTNIKIEKKNGKQYILWDKPKEKAEPEATDAIRYVVYEFFPGEEVDMEDSQTIIALTPYNSVQLPEDELENGTLFIVTALDRMNRESAPARVKIAK
jgi:hypothetical protein